MKIKPARHISWQTYENAVFILDERTETLRKLEGAAYPFWQLLMQTNEKKDIAFQLAELYNVPNEIIDNDLDSFIDELRKCEIIEVEQ